MGFADRLIFQTPAGDEPLVVERRPCDGATCPSCGSDDVREYPVAASVGPRMKRKCQSCYEVIEVRHPDPEDNWPPFRPAPTDWPASPAERASLEG
jgi:hypothetical protein